MSNNISIDDLFREGLAEGKEQLNLGAWANMERMLNGQNPYNGDESEPKKKKRIFPFFLFFLALTAVTSAGYIIFNKKENKSSLVSSKANNTQPLAINQIDKSNLNCSNPIAMHHEAEATENNIHTPNQINQPLATTTHQSNSNSVSKQNLIAGSGKQAGYKQTFNDDNFYTDNSGTNEIQPKNKLNRKSTLAANKVVKDDMQNLKGDNETLADISAATLDTKAAHKNTKTETINKVVTREVKVNNRNRSIENTRIDTIERSQTQVTKETEDIAVEENRVIRDKNYKYHPRYVNGLEDNEDEKPILLASAAEASAPALNEGAKTPSLQSNADEKEKRKKTQKQSVFGAIGAFSVLALNKIGETGGNFFSMFKVLDPGLSLGMNSALFKTNHNYGGFHAGLTNRTQISNLFSVITELKFFFRNNAGFTVNDVRVALLNSTTDSMAVQNSKIYSYQVDSTTKRYNFKNFMSLELPIMLNANFNNFSIYGGPNFVYNMRFKINEKTTTSVRNISDTVASNFNYSYPQEKSMQYARTDFGARFGIGYALGMSYSFHPKIYLDLRVSKVVWDNTKTNTQRDISNGVSKVPFTQLSLGYRFLNRNKD